MKNKILILLANNSKRVQDRIARPGSLVTSFYANVHIKLDNNVNLQNE